MTQGVQNFAAEVFLKAPEDLPVGALRTAIDEFERKGWASQRHLADCILRARECAEFLTLLSPARPQGESLFGGIEPDTAVTTEVLLDRLKPKVEALRQKLWNSSDPPFERYEDGVAWIERENELVCRREPASIPDELIAETLDLSHRWEKVFDAPVSVGLSRPDLCYLKLVSGGYVTQVLKPVSGSPLLELKRLVGPAASATGIEESALVSYVLTGRCPGIARISVGYTLGAVPDRPPEVRITIRSRNPTFKDLRDAYGMIQGLKKEGKCPAVLVDGVDRAIFAAIRETGKLPSGDVPRELWEKIAGVVASKGFDLNREAVRMRVARMLEKKGIPRESLYRDA